MEPLRRCPWANTDLSIAYHDREWGVPVHDDTLLFEFLVLEGAQAGLSWETILGKRPGYREAFQGFRPDIVARFGEKDVSRLLTDPGIVRNRRKVRSAIENARAFIRVQEVFDSFDVYLWRFVEGQPRQNAWSTVDEVPAHTHRSERLARDLKQRGFSFVGPTICYSFMQAVGMVNDHLVDCFRYEELRQATVDR